MKISKIKLNKNGKYEVTIDNTKYILYQDVIIKYLLFSKKEIDNNVLNDIIKDNIYYEAYDKIIKFIFNETVIYYSHLLQQPFDLWLIRLKY